MDAVILFWIGWTAGYLHTCQQKGNPPSWLYAVGSFWFFSLFWGDGMLWGSALCLLFWVLSWIPRLREWIVTWRWRGGDDDDDNGDDPRWLPEGGQGGGLVLSRVIREDDPWATPAPDAPVPPTVRPASPEPLPKYPGTVPGFTS